MFLFSCNVRKNEYELMSVIRVFFECFVSVFRLVKRLLRLQCWLATLVNAILAMLLLLEAGYVLVLLWCSSCCCCWCWDFLLVSWEFHSCCCCCYWAYLWWTGWRISGWRLVACYKSIWTIHGHLAMRTCGNRGEMR